MTVGRNKHELFSVCHHDLAFISQDRNFHLSSFSFHNILLTYVRTYVYVLLFNIQQFSSFHEKNCHPLFTTRQQFQCSKSFVFGRNIQVFHCRTGILLGVAIFKFSQSNSLCYGSYCEFFLLNLCEPLLVFTSRLRHGHGMGWNLVVLLLFWGHLALYQPRCGMVRGWIGLLFFSWKI